MTCWRRREVRVGSDLRFEGAKKGGKNGGVVNVCMGRKWEELQRRGAGGFVQVWSLLSEALVSGSAHMA